MPKKKAQKRRNRLDRQIDQAILDRLRGGGSQSGGGVRSGGGGGQPIFVRPDSDFVGTPHSPAPAAPGPSRQGGGRRRRGKNSSGSGGALFNQLQERVSTDFANDLRVDPRYADELAALRAELESQGGELPQLDEQTAADLAAMRESELQDVSRTFQEARDDLLLRAFAGGTQQSTILGDTGQRLVEGEGQVRSQVLSQDAQRRIAARTEMANRIHSNLLARADLIEAEKEAALQDIGVQLDQRNARIGFLDQMMARANSLQIAQIGAGAQVRSAQIGADASIQTAQIGAAADIRQSLIGRDTAITVEGIRTRGDIAQARIHAGAAVTSARIGADASMFGDILGFRGQQDALRENARQFGLDLGFREAGLRQSDRHFNRSHLQRQHEFTMSNALDKDRLALDWAIFDYQRREASRQRKRQTYAALFAAAGAAIGGYYGGGQGAVAGAQAGGAIGGVFAGG